MIQNALHSWLLSSYWLYHANSQKPQLAGRLLRKQKYTFIHIFYFFSTGKSEEIYTRFVVSFTTSMEIDSFFTAQPTKIDLNKKSLPKQKTIQNFTIDAQGFRKTKNENPPTRGMGVTSYPVPADLPTLGRLASTG